MSKYCIGCGKQLSSNTQGDVCLACIRDEKRAGICAYFGCHKMAVEHVLGLCAWHATQARTILNSSTGTSFKPYTPPVCKRGHEVDGPNMYRNSGRKGVRCKACQQAMTYAYRHPGIDVDAEAHARYAAILETGWDDAA